jgi:3-hydroxyacyl-CoA dehydrogenase
MSDLAPLDAAGLRASARAVRHWPETATLWDLGNGSTAFEIARPDNLISPAVIDALAATHDLASAEAAHLILTSDHPASFARGASGPFRDAIRTGETAEALAFLLDGQRILHSLRADVLPVVCAVHGLAFSGACEVALFANGLVVEETAPIGLKEIWMGFIPGWGGFTQLMLRHQIAGEDPLTAARTALTLCARGHIATGEDEARATLLFRDRDGTVPHRALLIPAAQALATDLARTPDPQVPHLRMPGTRDADALRAHVDTLDADLTFAEAECIAMMTLLDLLTATPDAILPDLDHMGHEAHAFLPLLHPRVAPRARHFAETGRRAPADI